MYVYDKPSLYAHVINGLLLLFAFVVFFKNYSKIVNVEPYKLISLILLFSLATGVHGLSHMGLEKLYNFNPIRTDPFR